MKDKKLSPKLIEELTLPKTYGNRQKKKPMKFNAIVSNPPYMIKDGGAGASATPVYNHFVDCAKKLSPGYISIIMPAKWYTDGKGLAKFRTDMLTDRHIEKLVDFVDEHVCFPVLTWRAVCAISFGTKTMMVTANIPISLRDSG